MFSSSLGSFKIFHANVRSLCKNFDNLLAHLQNVSHHYDIIVLTETWLNENSEQLFKIPGYESISLNRTGRGGGIRVYAMEGLITQCCTEFTAIFDTHESLFLRITLKNAFSFVLGCLYRPPSYSIPQFCEFLHNEILSNRLVLNSNCIFIGDFNIDLLNAENYLSIQTFCDYMAEGGFTQLINEPTRVNNEGLATSLLDHIWVNFDKVSYSGLVDSPFTDHIPIELHLKVKADNFTVIKRFRDLSQNNFLKFDTAKYELFRSYNFSSRDANKETTLFLIWLNNVLNKYFPIRSKNLSIKRIKMPWLTNDIMKLIHKKHKLFIALKKKLFPYAAYRAYSDLLKILINKVKMKYMRNSFKSNKNNSKKLWKSVDTILGRKSKNNLVHNEIKLSDNTVLKNNTDIAEAFNNYFNSIPTETQANLGPPIRDYSHLIPVCPNTLVFSESTPAEFMAVIQNLNNKGGTIELPISLIKYLKNELALILSQLFNLCIQTGHYPDAFKLARITPLYKSGSKSLISNYRPISLLPIFNKIFEKLLHQRIEHHFSSNNLISENQFGFRKQRDTQQATLKLVNEVLPTLGTETKAIGIFLDFSKAFDTVDHSLLLSKLQSYGVRDLSFRLIKSYLTDRSHYVSFSQVSSSKKHTATGVPQGSVLGPLFFNIYTNDINYLFNDEKLVLYADDSTLIACHSNSILLNFHVNYLLYKLSDWCKYNKLALNNKKTKWIFFTYRNSFVPTLYIDGVQIERVDVFKYLGFHIDCHLTHKFHVRFLTAKLSRFCYITSIIKKYITTESAKIIFYGIIQPVVVYGLLIYGGALMLGSSTHRLQRKYDKIVLNLFANRNETIHNINLVYKRNKILKIVDLYKCQCCVALFKILNENYAPFLSDSVNALERHHMYNFRHNNNFNIPFPNARSVKMNFVYNAISLWNNLSCDLKCLPNSTQFEKAFKSVCLASYN